jgi:hypothetical protein
MLQSAAAECVSNSAPQLIGNVGLPMAADPLWPIAPQILAVGSEIASILLAIVPILSEILSILTPIPLIGLKILAIASLILTIPTEVLSVLLQLASIRP